LTGELHLISLLLAAFDPPPLITLPFMVAYLIIVFFLFRDSWAILWFGAIVPLVGLLLAAIGMMNHTLLGAIFIAIDITIAACCFIVIFRNEQNL